MVGLRDGQRLSLSTVNSTLTLTRGKQSLHAGCSHPHSATMMGHHGQHGQHGPSSPSSPPAPLSRSWSNRGAARLNNLGSAMRGLSISDPSPQAVSPGAALSPMPSALGRGMLGTESQGNGAGTGSGRAPAGPVGSAYDEFARVIARSGSVAETVERLESMGTARGGPAAGGDIDSLKASFSALGLGDPLAPAGLSCEGRARHGKGRSTGGVRDYVISPRGNAVLEFENTGALDTPLLRFRVSSHMLAETSPIFEAVFGGQFSHPRVLDRDLRELDGQVPREPPRSVACADGSCVRLYSMPQLEPNREEALTILLYAAHMRNDKVPREVSFARFTAIADVCLRYMCTSPLELMVEHRWLPAWVHKATEQQPDGILLISYAFGLRRLFTRMSKTAVLNIVDEQDLRAKPWPKAIKDKIWAVRSAKLAQAYSTCASAVQEYFRPPARQPRASNDTGAGEGPPMLPASYPTRTPLPSYISLMSLTSAPRCPRGDHWCDATSLGWLLLVLNELQLAWTVVNPSALPHAQSQQSQPPRSLAQLLDVLRSIPSPRHPPHPGSTVCDPAPAFRAAVNDVYNSIGGLTLFDVDGKRHGWALSKHRLNEPQTIQNVSLGKLSTPSLTGSTIQHELVAPAQAPSQDTRGLVQVDAEDPMPGNSSDIDSTLGQGQDIQQGNAPGDMPWQHPPLTFAPDEALFLRIMKNAETFDDLHAIALVSRASYAAFRNNELSLMRPLVGARRRQTLSALAGGPPQPQDLLPQELARLEGLQASSKEQMPRNRAPDPSPPLLSRHQSTVDDALAEAAQLESSCPDDVEGRYEAAASDGREAEDAREMTEEEAGLILWPEQTAPSSFRVATGYLAKGEVAAAPARGAADRDDSDDKFLAQDLCLLPEHKSLAVLGDKSLGIDLDTRKGINTA